MNFLLLAVATLMGASVPDTYGAVRGSVPAAAANRTQIYAPPLVFGPWTEIQGHAGDPVTYRVEVDPIGSTEVFGEVRYHDEEGRRRVVAFRGEVTFRVGKGVGPIEVRLKGVPTGSSCWVDIQP